MCALTPTELTEVLLGHTTQTQECLAVQHDLAARLPLEQWREVSRIDDAIVCSVWCTGVLSQLFRVMPDDDALAMDAHRNRRADVLDNGRQLAAALGQCLVLAAPPQAQPR